jgi:transcription elongation factor GreA
LVFRGEFYEANPGSSTRNTEANRSASNLNRPHMSFRRIPALLPLPLPSGAVNEDVKNAISPEGRAEAEAELKELTEARRPAIVAAIKAAREEGDLSENAEYHAAREKQSFVEGRIADLETKVGAAEVIEPPTSGDRVTFGSTVLLEDEAGKEVRYQIVGSDETDPARGRISILAPLARTLIGNKVGDTVTAQLPGGKKRFAILKANFPWE